MYKRQMQLVGTTVFSVIFLGEWSSMTQIIFGLIAMILLVTTCLLYTSDAADEARSVDLGGRRKSVKCVMAVSYTHLTLPTKLEV
ncbi:hypothetical protein JMUB7547_28250 [Staphylococcus aureus]